MMSEAFQDPESLYHSKDGNGNPANPNEALLQVIIRHRTGSIRSIGTGFFIASPGVFASAKHVLDDLREAHKTGDYCPEVIQFRDDNKAIVRQISRVSTHKFADVGVGMLYEYQHNQTGEILGNKKFVLSLTYPMNDETTFTYAFPESEVDNNDERKIINVMPGYYSGQVSEYLPNGRDRVFLPYPCYRTTIHLKHGVSGGPVFSEKGKVLGINSTGFEGERLSYISRIQDIYDLELDGVILSEDSPARVVSIRELVARGQISVG